MPECTTPTPDAGLPVLVLSGHVAMKVRLRAAIEPFAPVEFVATESELQALLARPARLIVIDGAALSFDCTRHYVI